MSFTAYYFIALCIVRTAYCGPIPVSLAGETNNLTFQDTANDYPDNNKEYQDTLKHIFNLYTMQSFVVFNFRVNF